MKYGHPFPSLAVINLAQKYLSSSGVVLDVGCNRGQTGRILKKRISCQVIGIDNSPQVVKQAKRFLDQVILADVETSHLNLTKTHFDLIILSNILEHLRDPLMVLKHLKKYLKPQGYILIAVPNVAFWSIRLDLLLGKFNYQEAGILSQEHLRFFTRLTLQNLVAKSGLRIKETTTNYLGWRNRIASLWPKLLASQLVILCELS